MSQALSLLSLLTQLKQAMQHVELWHSDAPTAAALASDAPFCVDTLHFSQWLQFVLHPKLLQLIDQQQPLPSNIAVLPMAEHAFQLEAKPTEAILVIIGQIDQLLTQGGADAR